VMAVFEIRVTKYKTSDGQRCPNQNRRTIMNKQEFKESYRLARLSAKSHISCDDVPNYWLVYSCLRARGAYQYIDLYCKDIVGAFKRHVIRPKGCLPR